MGIYRSVLCHCLRNPPQHFLVHLYIFRLFFFGSRVNGRGFSAIHLNTFLSTCTSSACFFLVAASMAADSPVPSAPVDYFFESLHFLLLAQHESAWSFYPLPIPWILPCSYRLPARPRPGPPRLLLPASFCNPKYSGLDLRAHWPMNPPTQRSTFPPTHLPTLTTSAHLQHRPPTHPPTHLLASASKVATFGIVHPPTHPRPPP